VHGCRAAVDRMRPRGHGHIVNIASVLAVRPPAGFAVYSAAKAGVLALSASLRRELRGDGIHVTAVLPYLLDTAGAAGLRPRLVPPLRPDHVADAVPGALRRPCPQVFVPRAGRLLTYAALLPARLQDAADTLFRTDHIALGADTASRAPSETELRKQVTAR
jgi:short-subunit dehydrogenase